MHRGLTACERALHPCTPAHLHPCAGGITVEGRCETMTTPIDFQKRSDGASFSVWERLDLNNGKLSTYALAVKKCVSGRATHLTPPRLPPPACYLDGPKQRLGCGRMPSSGQRFGCVGGVKALAMQKPRTSES